MASYLRPIVKATSLITVAISFATSSASPLAAQDELAGTYLLASDATIEINRAINEAVRSMNFIIRPIARSRLRRANVPYDSLTITHTPDEVTTLADDERPVVTPASGEPVKWVRDERETLDVTTRWLDGTLEQTFTAGDGQRVNRYTPGPDGTMMLDVTVTSPRLPRPVSYQLLYKRRS